jgi:hypothetical protein
VLRVLVFVAHDPSKATAMEKRISFRISDYWMRKHNPAFSGQNWQRKRVSTKEC